MTILRIRTDSYDTETSRTTFDAQEIRIQRKERQVGMGREGNPVFTQMRIFFPPDSGILRTDKIVHQGQEFPILSYYEAADLNGQIDHLEVDI